MALEIWPVGVMKEPGPEHPGPVLPIGAKAAVGSLLFQKCYDPLPVLVIVLDLPVVRWLGTTDHQAPGR